jgi:hypothetical protein
MVPKKRIEIKRAEMTMAELSHNLVIRKSKIHGKGVFTTCPIKKKTGFYKVPLKKIFNEPRSKCAFIGKNRWVCDNKVLNWINHSCEANALLDLSNDPPILIATKDIHRGEEITCNYNKTEIGGVKVACNCASDKCKRYFLVKK